ncbi:DUF697 domain-containing protein [Thiomicrospira sp.]|uniref:DUF697 domain-containing protein n=1 Tax=Thiomicrospira sp. TaxID=935 RepID=UPI002F92F6C4
MTQRSRTQTEPLNQDLDDLVTRPESSSSSSEPLKDESVDTSIGMGFWLISFGLLSLLSFMAFDVYLTLQQAWLVHPVLSAGLGFVSVVFFGLLLGLITREIVGYWRMGHIQQVAEKWQQAIEQDDVKQAKNLLNYLLSLHAKSPKASALAQAYKNTIKSHHNIEQQWFIYDTMVAKPLLAQAKAIINKEALQAGGVGLLSPNNMIETLMLMWRSARVVRRIANLYGYRPGLVGNIKLLRMSLENVIIQQATDMLIEEGVSVLGKGLLSGLSQQAGKAASTGVLVKRIGKSALFLLNPFNAPK